MKGVVASGHPLTAKAAAEMLSLGGNAFDAAVAAGFASVVVEPALTSLGGGGFMLAHNEDRHEDILFDFFVNTPGLGRKGSVKPDMIPTDVKFTGCVQVFHTGFGSAAVPGMLKGLLHIHKRLGTLPIHEIIKPALSYLEEGVELIEQQGKFLGLLKPIYLLSDYGREIYMRGSRYVEQNDRLFNPLLKDFFHGIEDGSSDIYSGETVQKLMRKMEQHNGMITPEDLEAYEVIERKPLSIRYRDVEILTNPPPSSGGVMLAFGMHLIENIDLSELDHNSEKFLVTLAELVKEMHDFKPMVNGNHWKYPFSRESTSELVNSFMKNVSERTFVSTQGTTHISVIDGKGNAASMTTSNGSGSGCFIPGTGIMLNNMMGEDDLHPDGFFSSPPNKRVSSMMIPSITMKDGRVDSVLGSGGSKRIKTAILQVLINIIDYNYPLKDAVESSRLHFEDGILQAEPGVPQNVTDKLGKYYNVNKWKEKNVYFGGVHCVNSRMEGWGDSRRGGSVMVQE